MPLNQHELYAKVRDQYVPTSYHIFEFLTNSADDSADMHGVDVTSGTPERFSWTCLSGHSFALNRCNISIVDGAMTPAKFGGLSALDTGMMINEYAANGTTVNKDFLDGSTIKKNADWALLVGRDNTITVAAGVGGLPIRWSLFKSSSPVFLAAGESFAFCLQDSTTGIDDFRAKVQGLQYPNNL